MTQKNLVQIFDRQQVRSIYDTEQEKMKLAKEGSELSEKIGQLKM